MQVRGHPGFSAAQSLHRWVDSLVQWPVSVRREEALIMSVEMEKLSADRLERAPRSGPTTPKTDTEAAVCH